MPKQKPMASASISIPPSMRLSRLWPETDKKSMMRKILLHEFPWLATYPHVETLEDLQHLDLSRLTDDELEQLHAYVVGANNPFDGMSDEEVEAIVRTDN